MNIVTENRIGKFKITKEIIERADEELFLLFAKIIIVRCTFIYHSKCFEYHGYSEMFEPIEKFSELPEYLIEYFKNGTREITINAKKLGGG